MENLNISKSYNNNEEDEHILQLVKSALKEADLLEKVEIEERNDGFMLKPKKYNKDDKVKFFESLAGSALTVGDDSKDLIKMANREEYWRREDIE